MHQAEEKRPLIEDQLKKLLYGRDNAPRQILGKQDEQGKPLLPEHGEVTPGEARQAVLDEAPFGLGGLAGDEAGRRDGAGARVGNRVGARFGLSVGGNVPGVGCEERRMFIVYEPRLPAAENNGFVLKLSPDWIP